MKEEEIRSDLAKTATIKELIENAKKIDAKEELVTLSSVIQSLLDTSDTISIPWKYLFGWLEERGFKSYEDFEKSFQEFKQFHKRPSVLAE